VLSVIPSPLPGTNPRSRLPLTVTFPRGNYFLLWIYLDIYYILFMKSYVGEMIVYNCEFSLMLCLYAIFFIFYVMFALTMN
jgi:hypothetical protein